MELNYLDFETTEDGEGGGSFDALAAVPRERWPALEAEVLQVLAWAEAAFGPPAPLDEGGEWDCELQATEEVATPCAVQWQPGARALGLQRGAAGTPRIAFGLTLTGSPAFCDALRQALGAG